MQPKTRNSLLDGWHLAAMHPHTLSLPCGPENIWKTQNETVTVNPSINSYRKLRKQTSQQVNKSNSNPPLKTSQRPSLARTHLTSSSSSTNDAVRRFLLALRAPRIRNNSRTDEKRHRPILLLPLQQAHRLLLHRRFQRLIIYMFRHSSSIVQPPQAATVKSCSGCCTPLDPNR